MQDYLFIIKTEGSVWTDLSPEQLQKHMEHGGIYIGNLMKKGVLKGANPIDKNGSRIVTQSNGTLKDGPYNESKEIVAGFFHITAADMDEAVKIAKDNPIFKDIPTKIEIYPMMPNRWKLKKPPTTIYKNNSDFGALSKSHFYIYNWS